MGVHIRIHRDRKNDGKAHKGVIIFENGVAIPFTIPDEDLKEIHNDGVLKDTQLPSGKNIYQGTFEIVDEE